MLPASRIKTVRKAAKLASIGLITLASVFPLKVSAQSVDWQRVVWREPQVRYLRGWQRHAPTDPHRRHLHVGGLIAGWRLDFLSFHR